MIRTAFFGLAAIGLLCTAGLAPVQAQGKFNKKVAVGDKAPSYSELPGVDGKKHSLADLSNKDVVVVVVTCNHCPVAIAYEDRIIDFTKKFAGKDSKVAVVAINVNTSEADGLPKMIERAKEKGFNFPYLYDETQQIARGFGATKTPEFFVLGKDRKIVYMGAMDDSQNSPKMSYLEPAVQAALKGSMPTVTETQPRGCGVQYNK
jgi:peroxiredoxin